MARIKIKKVPNGFEVKNGKLLKKASYGGGFVTGDQMDYGLVTTYGADNGNDKKESNVRFSLASVPREFANIEAEGGETVLTDLNGNGSFGLYNITGPRHSQGGVPMYLPDQSFIFSDTPKMKMKSDELAKFGIESRKGMTPAAISKKFPLNEFKAAAGDPESDYITEKSAELMLDKNMMSLSKLAFGQEMKKGFEDGVPTAAFPFIQSLGEDPVNFAAMIDSQIAQRNSKAAYGLEIAEDKQPVLPKAQDGTETIDFSTLPTAIRNSIQSLIDNAPDKNDPELQRQIKAIIDRVNAVQNSDDISSEDRDEVINDVAEIVADNVEELQKIGRLPLITEDMAKIDNLLKSSGIDVQAVMDVGDKGIEDTQNRAESGLYGDVTMENLPQWFENNKALLEDLGYSSYDALTEKLGDEWYKDSEFVRGFQDAKNKSLSDKYDKDPELRAQLEERGITKEQFIQAYGFRTDGEDGETDSIDGKFGEYTLNRRDFFGLPDEPDTDPDPDPDPVPGERVTPIPDFYRQDMVKMDALSKRDRGLFTPDRMAVEQIELDPVLMDPTRAIAAINEQAAIGADAAGMFGPQTLSANTARNTGTAFKNIADTIAKYDAANVGILNKADTMQARFDQLTDAEERKNYAEVTDGTNLALQNYMDERNLDREQFADLYANALTNRANTYNLNTLIPYFDIDPRSGGMVANVDSAGLFQPTKPADPYAQLEKLMNLSKLANAAGLETEPINVNQLFNQGSGLTAAQSLLPIMGNLGYQQNPVPPAKKGKTVKAPVVPFYIGTTDGRRK